MTIASVLLALLTATSTPAGDSTGPALLDFHAEWCGPCQKMRPAVEQLIRKGYPIKTIDIDQEARAPPALPCRERSDVHRGRWLRTRARSNRRPPVRRRTRPLLQGRRRPRRSRRPTPMPTPARATTTATTADDDDDHGRNTRAHSGQDNGKTHRRRSATRMTTPTRLPNRRLPIPSHGKPSSGSGSSSNRSTGFGSGTIIYSTPEESLILTCAHIFKIEGRQASRSVRVPATDHDRSVRRQPQGAETSNRSTFWRRSRAGRSITISPRRRADPDPAGPPAARLSRGAIALAAPTAHAGAHGRLLGRARRDGVAHDDHQGTHPELSCRAIRATRRSNATWPPSKGVPAADCSPTMATSPACATSPSRKGITDCTPRLGRFTSCSTVTT